MAEKQQFDVLIQGPTGVVKKTMSGPSIKAIGDEINALGMKPLKIRPSAPESRTTTETTSPGAGTEAASVLGQVGLGALGGSAGGPGGALLGGLAGGLAPYIAARGGQFPTGREALGVAAGEIPVGKAGRLLPPGMRRPLENVGERVVSRGGEALGRLMGNLREPAQQALEGSGLVRETAAGAVGSISRQPTAIAGDILNRAKKMLRASTEERFTSSETSELNRITGDRTASDVQRTTMDTGEENASRTLTDTTRSGQADVSTEMAKSGVRRIEPTMQQALKETTASFGVDLSKMDSREFLQLVREAPERAAAAVQAFETASGQRLMEPGQLQQLWVADVLQHAGSRVREGARGGRGLLIDPGGAYLLDGQRVASAWKALTPEGRLTMGPDFAQAFDGLVSKIDALPKAARGGQRIVEKGMVPMTAPIAGIMKYIQNLSPTAKIGGTLGAGYLATRAADIGRSTVSGIEEHPLAATAGLALGAGVGAISLTRKGLTKLTERLLSTPEGLRWLTSGVDQIGRGLPSVMVADGLSRALMRSPKLVASLGLPTPPQQVMPGQQAAFAAPGMPMPGMR